MSTFTFARWIVFFIGVGFVSYFINAYLLYLITKKEPEKKRYIEPSYGTVIFGLIVILVSLELPMMFPGLYR